jgi:chorismate dehydratase
MVINLGALSFNNAIPINTGMVLPPDLASAVRWHYDHPAGLNHAVGKGLLDVSPVSSVYYGQHQSQLTLLSGISISSGIGPVASVMVAYPQGLPAHDAPPPTQIAVPTHSETSIALLQLLLSKQGVYPLPQWVTYPPSEHHVMLAKGLPTLVIGDPALSLSYGNYPHWDLAQAWRKITGYPMVFAVWVANRSWVTNNPQSFSTLQDAFARSHDRFFSEPMCFRQGLAQALDKSQKNRYTATLTSNCIRDYWLHNLSFQFNTTHQEALTLFLADYSQLINVNPQLPIGLLASLL